MSRNSIKTVGRSEMVNMGEIRLRQPIPTASIENVDPFLLLHHYGPFEISETNNPFDLGPHPHRGFEPITFLIQGEQLHRDSLGHESVVKSGDVQWSTAGRGIIHAEGPTQDLIKRGGTLEGIQLWLNLPADKKMIPAAYQHEKAAYFNTIDLDKDKLSLQIIAGAYDGLYGRIQTQTPVQAYMITSKVSGAAQIKIEAGHQALLYLISGQVMINAEQQLEVNEKQLVVFKSDGDYFDIEALGDSQLLFLSGLPINEEISMWGPYVMNTQTEIMEALRDYQQGKMGFLPAKV